MKTSTASETDLNSPVEGVFADLSNLIPTAPQKYPPNPPPPGDGLIEWPAMGGVSFVDANPWPRGGLNE